MSTGFIADCHIGSFSKFGGTSVSGISYRCGLTLDCFDLALTTAENEGCDELVIAGDLFESDRPTPQIISMVQDILSDHKKLHVIVAKGNHDCRSYAANDHALGPLRNFCTVVDSPTRLLLGSCNCIIIPFSNTEDYVEKALEELAESSSRPTIVCMHMGVSSKNTPPWLKDKPDALDLSNLEAFRTKYNLDYILSGHWHQYASYAGGHIVQIGALCPRGFTDPGVDKYGALLVHEGTSIVGKEVCGPRFVVSKELEGATSKKWKELEAFCKKTRNTIFAQITTRSECAEQIQQAIKNLKLGGHEVFVERSSAEEELNTVGEVSCGDDIMERAVYEYVNEMKTDVEKKDLLTLVKGYISDAKKK